LGVFSTFSGDFFRIGQLKLKVSTKAWLHHHSGFHLLVIVEPWQDGSYDAHVS